jgi:N-acyl-D-amino-acid deacylase
MRAYRFGLVWVLVFGLAACRPPATFYDTVIRHGTVYDGSGARPTQADVAISGDSIVAVGARLRGRARKEIDAQGLAVAPGFINMLS